MKPPVESNSSFVCPLPTSPDSQTVSLAHGEGGRLTRQFIRERIVSRFSNETLAALGDAALITVGSERIAFSSDGYTVTPLFFPGGDIGRLAVFGTVNDLAVTGAVPRWIGLSMIIEEGLAWSVVDRILDSVQAAARQTNVTVVTGDTKVVPRGTCDGMFITTSGIGEIVTPVGTGPSSLQVGDVLIVSGPVGRHGAAIMNAREDLGFDPSPISDCASVATPLIELHRTSLTPRAVRDATRGGVAAVLHEWSEASGLSCSIEESLIPVSTEVRAVCELLGLDPLHLANEGTFVLATSHHQVDSTLSLLKHFEVTRDARIIGEVVPRRIVPVVLRRSIGSDVPLDDPAGAPLPRIC